MTFFTRDFFVFNITHLQMFLFVQAYQNLNKYINDGDGEMEQSADYVYGNLEAPAEDDDTVYYNVFQFTAKNDVYVHGYWRQ